MALLTPPAIALLERLVDHGPAWTTTDALALRPTDHALDELEREGLAETEIWPPPDPARSRGHRIARVLDRQVVRVIRVRRTGRGEQRLQRIRAGRSRT